MFPSEKIQDAIFEAFKNVKVKWIYVVLIFTVIILMIFWFFGIYFMDHNFYAHTPLWITILLCFALGFGWLFLSIQGGDYLMYSYREDEDVFMILFKSSTYAIEFLGSGLAGVIVLNRLHIQMLHPSLTNIIFSGFFLNQLIHFSILRFGKVSKIRNKTTKKENEGTEKKEES